MGGRQKQKLHANMKLIINFINTGLVRSP
jgi:hypothetical protein